jgi:hypothetical protein
MEAQERHPLSSIGKIPGASAPGTLIAIQHCCLVQADVNTEALKFYLHPEALGEAPAAADR